MCDKKQLCLGSWFRVHSVHHDREGMVVGGSREQGLTAAACLVSQVRKQITGGKNGSSLKSHPPDPSTSSR